MTDVWPLGRWRIALPVVRIAPSGWASMSAPNSGRVCEAWDDNGYASPEAALHIATFDPAVVKAMLDVVEAAIPLFDEAYSMRVGEQEGWIEDGDVLDRAEKALAALAEKVK